MKDERFLAIINEMIDDRIQLYGYYNTICFLLNHGMTKDELLELTFPEEDIDHVIKYKQKEGNKMIVWKNYAKVIFKHRSIESKKTLHIKMLLLFGFIPLYIYIKELY